MTKLTWTNSPNRPYQYGVDRAALRIAGGTYVAWSGLVSVSESEVDATDVKVEFDGAVVGDLRFGGQYEAKLSAYGYPIAFAPCLGEVSPVTGIILTNQAVSRFDLTYRTMTGPSSYLIHIIYNATIIQTQGDTKTLSTDTSASVFQFKIGALPDGSLTGRRPTAHLVIDSQKTSSSALTTIENALYGTASVDPVWLTMQQFIDTV